MAEVAWRPSKEVVERANVTAFVRRHGLRDVAELVARSRADPAWFWGVVEKDLGFEWFHPYEQVVDLSKGKPWARWYVGGTTNLALNCLDRHARGPARDRAAVRWEGEEGATRTWTYAELAAETNRLAN